MEEEASVPRMMPFSATLVAFRAMEKDTTRRLGWAHAKVGDVYWGVDRCMGFKKGEHPEKIHLIQIKEVGFEPLEFMHMRGVGEVRREGFPDMSVEQFIQMFIGMHRGKGVTRTTPVNRIVWDFLPAGWLDA
jgi:hypothetical protein